MHSAAVCIISKTTTNTNHPANLLPRHHHTLAVRNFDQLPQSIPNRHLPRLSQSSRGTHTLHLRHTSIQRRCHPQALRSLMLDKGMSNLLRIYREHALELLYALQTSSDTQYKWAQPKDTYLDLQVLCQDHPAFPLYILMSASHTLKGDVLIDIVEAGINPKTTKYHLSTRCRIFRNSKSADQAAGRI
jgi:hypothetical protein